MRVNILASNNFFERRIDTESIYRNAVQFQILGKYMFVTKYAGNDKKHLDLFVSMTGEKFVQAREVLSGFFRPIFKEILMFLRDGRIV